MGKKNIPKVHYFGWDICIDTLHIQGNNQQSILCNYLNINKWSQYIILYHTQDPEWCVKSLLNLNNVSEDFFGNNKRLKAIIKAKGNF